MNPKISARIRNLLRGAIFPLATAASVRAAERFPRPEFETGYRMPATTHPALESVAWEWIDMAALAVGLGGAVWLLHARRSRRGLLLLAVLAVAYFGFVRRGCVCAVGSVQNIALGWGDPVYVPSAGILLFFLLPLAVALFYGRVFCAGVCPLGALQEWVLIRPVRIPWWIDRPLRFLPWLVLGTVVLLAATGGGFLLCEFDPFVRIFRLSGTLLFLLFGAGVLLLATFIGRPYCRYACPYGALLSVGSRLAPPRLRPTPDRCVGCGLCEEACPYGAIRPPDESRLGEKRFRERRWLAAGLLAIPLLALLGALGARRLQPIFEARYDPIPLSRLLQKVEAGRFSGEDDRLDAFRQSDRPADAIHAEAREAAERLAAGLGWTGALLGGIAGLHLVGLTRRRRRETYEIDSAHCVACGRCIDACPRERAGRREADS